MLAEYQSVCLFVCVTAGNILTCYSLGRQAEGGSLGWSAKADSGALYILRQVWIEKDAVITFRLFHVFLNRSEDLTSST